MFRVMRPAKEPFLIILGAEAEEVGDKKRDARAPAGAAVKGQGRLAILDLGVDDALVAPASGNDGKVPCKAL